MPNQAFYRAAALADVSRLLAACYYEPGPEFAEERLFDAMIEAAQRIDAALAEKASLLKTAFEADSQQELLVDYAHLFLGPVGLLALPYESAWLEKQGVPSSEATQALLDLFADGGFEVDPDFRDLPDHIAVELEFLYTTYFRMAAAIRDADLPAINESIDLRQRLIDLHLKRWCPDFCAAVNAGAQCRFYRELADLTVQLIAVARREGV
ncbi:MAG: molecular chaperone TorD family protein [Propionivibrio sp.]